MDLLEDVIKEMNIANEHLREAILLTEEYKVKRESAMLDLKMTIDKLK